MTILQLALAFAFALLLAGAAAFCLWAAVRYERPTWSAPWLTVATWWMGQALAAILLLVLAGGILGAATGAAWKLVTG